MSSFRRIARLFWTSPEITDSSGSVKNQLQFRQLHCCLRAVGRKGEKVKFKLIIFDIDGTIAEPLSSWRYVHERLGLWDEPACLYQERFLAGKISYRKFCELDAAHWRGLPEKKIKNIFRKAPYSRNAVRSIKKLRKMGFKLAAVSTGLQYMADRVKKELKFNYVSANRLISRRGVLTGGVKINITHGAKGHILRKILRKFHVKPHEAICVGDSAGDIPLAKASGFSIAFNSSDETFSRIVNYNCHTNDFNEVFEIIRLISEGKANEEMIRAARGGDLPDDSLKERAH